MVETRIRPCLFGNATQTFRPECLHARYETTRCDSELRTGQEQLYPKAARLHVPPFMHGADAQSAPDSHVSTLPVQSNYELCRQLNPLEEPLHFGLHCCCAAILPS